MSRLDAISNLVPDSRFQEFAAFVLASGPDEQRPDFNALDLMRVAKLVPNIYVIDFRPGIENGLLVKFAGTQVEANFSRKLQGGYLDDAYTGNDRKELILGTYRRAYEFGESFYTRRVVRYEEEREKQKYRIATVLFLVCFDPENRVEFGIGLTDYVFGTRDLAPVFKIV